MIDRRTFLAGTGAVLLAAPLAAGALQAGKVPRIGFLGESSPSDRPPLLDAFRQRLRELGWVEGQNIVIDYRYAEGRVDRLPDLAAELVRLKVDLIVSMGTQGVTAAKNATETIPIVMIAVRDPVSTGLIASLARPGGNMTGVSGYAGLEIVAKQLELLKETVPKIRRVAILSNPANAYHQLAIREVHVAARSSAVQLQLLEARFGCSRRRRCRSANCDGFDRSGSQIRSGRPYCPRGGCDRRSREGIPHDCSPRHR